MCKRTLCSADVDATENSGSWTWFKKVGLGEYVPHIACLGEVGCTFDLQKGKYESYSTYRMA